ncbi:MAG: phosphoenolpyruvate carboxykinase (GTP) [Proteobacteria bacterium]|nr:phosphoenolpyruvate carboxykinase (GTP) [Pseudomonadota bacterium]
MNTPNQALKQWISQAQQHLSPDRVVWCDGSQAEHKAILAGMVESKEMIPLNKDSYPDCYLYRSHPDDVARAEHLTYICTPHKEDAGANNNWLSPKEGHQRVDPLFKNCMQGRTMYVIPYSMGPCDSPYAQFGVEITDSPYVVANMYLMTHMGKEALEYIDKLDTNFVRGLHSTGDLSSERRWIMHFPDEMMIKSFGSGYGGNALLGKKCHALRLASVQAKQEGWLAEHMLIVGIENPQGEKTYIAGAFPSACGKTNLAMLIPPNTYKGWKVWTVGDDIAWLRPGADGRLWAINPEAGFFGVAPGTSQQTNPHAYNMLHRNAIFTNVAMTPNKEPWWEGKEKDDNTTTSLTDWKGQTHTASSATTAPMAHPNARFTVSCHNCDSFEKPGKAYQGVPISAILFGSRRRSLVPLVFEAKDWLHGVLTGAAMCSETTAAATGKVGVLRHDPMAMKPFCGYNFGDYWNHWLKVGTNLSQPPKVFHVNWFRQDSQNQYMWPGFGDNIRVLEWILKRCHNQVDSQETPLGVLPLKGDINIENTTVTGDTLNQLLTVNGPAYADHLTEVHNFFQTFAPRNPQALMDTCTKMINQLKNY